MYYKKKKYKKNRYKKKYNYKKKIVHVPVKGKNYYIDEKGRKHFWLTKRVPTRLFKLLRFKFNFVYKRWIFNNKKWRFYYFFFKNLKYLKSFFIFLFLKKCKKNIFANFSNAIGNVIYKASSGFFYKRSLRKTFFATSYLLRQMRNTVVLKKLFLQEKKKKRKRKIFFFLNIIGGNYQRGFKKNLKDFIKKRSSKFYKISELKCKAHNGVRKSKKRRK